MKTARCYNFLMKVCGSLFVLAVSQALSLPAGWGEGRTAFTDPVWQELSVKEGDEMRSGISLWDDPGVYDDIPLTDLAPEDIKDLYARFSGIMTGLKDVPAGPDSAKTNLSEWSSSARKFGRAVRSMYMRMSEEDMEQYGRIVGLIGESTYFFTVWATRSKELPPEDAARWIAVKEDVTREIEREYLKVVINVWGAASSTQDSYSENGFGTASLPDGSIYEGYFRDGLFHGQGTRTWKDGHKYEGEYKDGLPHGHGVETWSDGTRYEGEFLDGEIHGKGTVHWKDGRSYPVDNR